VRVSDDLRRCVVFIGFEDDTPASAGIRCASTAFFIVYKASVYLVTAKHAAVGIGDAPFVIRINNTDGTSDNLHCDGLDFRWYCHDDPNVDLAVLPFNYDLRSHGHDFKYLPEQIIVDATHFTSEDIGIGDLCDTVGLFRLLAGHKRNLPVVHTGNIALLPGDEKVPVSDWDSAKSGNSRLIEAYLVESQSIQGLSGAPVFVRPTVGFDLSPIGPKTRLSREQLYLLGVWQGAWDAKPGEALAADRGGRDIRVPVGIGVVTPAIKLIELMESSELQKQREELGQRRAAQTAAMPD
jgi:hypothetical protein